MNARNLILMGCSSRAQALWQRALSRGCSPAIAAIDNGIRPVICADFASSSGAFRSVARYAENYNRRMLELTKRQAK